VSLQEESSRFGLSPDLIRIGLKRISNLQPGLVVLLSVGLALVIGISIASNGSESIEREAQQYDYSTWGYSLLVYRPGAIFWTVFELYRLSRCAPIETPPAR